MQVRRLLDQGYELWEVESSRDMMEATFRRGVQREIVRFSPGEAEALLLAKGPLRLNPSNRGTGTTR